MDIIKGDILTLEKEKYIVVETLNHKDNSYIFTNKLLNDEEISKEYNIFKVDSNYVENIESDELYNLLLEKFKDLLSKDLNHFLERNNN